MKTKPEIRTIKVREANGIVERAVEIHKFAFGVFGIFKGSDGMQYAVEVKTGTPTYRMFNLYNLLEWMNSSQNVAEYQKYFSRLRKENPVLNK